MENENKEKQENSENETGEKNIPDASTESNVEPKISAENDLSDNTGSS